MLTGPLAGSTAQPPGFTKNPNGCGKFVVNMFKAGSGKCRDCGHEWHQHDGVIDRQVAEKFVQIWKHAMEKQALAAAVPMKSEVQQRAEERHAYLEKHRRGSTSEVGHEWYCDHATEERKFKSLSDQSSDEEELRMYSKEEFLERERAALSGMSTKATVTPVMTAAHKPVKVVNLIDFSDEFVRQDVRPARPPSPRVVGAGGSASPRGVGLTGSSSPRLMGASGSASPRVVGAAGSSPRVVGLTGSSSPRMVGAGSSSPRVMGLTGSSPRVAAMSGSLTPGHLSLPQLMPGHASPDSLGMRKLEAIEHQVQFMTRELTEKTSEINRLHSELEVATAKVHEQEHLATTNKEESRSLIDQLEVVMRENAVTVDQLRQQLQHQDIQAKAEREEEVARLTAQIADSQSVTAALTAELESLKVAHGQLQTLQGSDNAVIGELKIELGAKRDEASAAAERIDQLTSQLDASKSASDQWSAELESLKVENAQLRDQAGDEHAVIEQLRIELAAKNEVESTTRERLTQLTSQLDASKSAQDALMVEFESLKAENTQLRAQAGDEHAVIEQLRIELSAKSDEASAAVDRINQLSAELSASRSAHAELESLKEENTQLRSQGGHVDEEGKRLRAELDTVSAESRIVQDKFNSEREILKQENSQLRSELDALQVKIAEADSAQQAKEAELAELRSGLDESGLTQQQLQTERDAFATQLAEAGTVLEETSASLHAALKATESEKSAACEQLAMAQEELAFVQRQLEELRLSNNPDQEMAVEIASLKEHIVRLESELASTVAESSDWKLRVGTAFAREQELLTELRGVRNSLTESSTQSEELNILIDSLRVELDAARDAQEHLHQVIARLEAEVDASRSGDDRIQVLETERNDLQSEIGSLSSQIAALTEELISSQSAQAAFTTLTSEHEALVQQYSELGKSRTDTIASLEGKVAELVKSKTETISTHEAKIAELVKSKTETIASLEGKIAELGKSKTEQESQLGIELWQLQNQLKVMTDQAAVKSSEVEELTQKLAELERLESTVADLRSATESDKRSVEALKAQVTEKDSVIAKLESELSQTGSAREAAESEMAALDKEITGLRTMSVQLETEVGTLERKVASSESELESARAALMTTDQELKYARSQMNAETDMGRAEIGRLQAEIEDLRAKLATDSQSSATANSRVLQAEQTIHELREKLALAQQDLAEANRSRQSADLTQRQSDMYLKAIQDVSFVVKTVTDKFLSPNASEANSRAVSMEEEGAEAILQLERHTKALLRLVDAVTDKAKILEKENDSLENKLVEYENINTVLRERINQSFMHRMIEPIISCSWKGARDREPALLTGTPIQPRPGNEMSHLIAPPRQQGGMNRD